MAAEELIQKIINDGRERAAAIRARAQERSEEIRRRTQETIAKLETDSRETTRRETEAILERSRSRARLERNKRLLAGRWAVIDNVISQALERFIQSPDYPKLIAGVVQRLAGPGSTVHLSQEDTRRFGTGLGFQPGEPVAIKGGVIIRNGPTELNFSLDELGKLARAELAGELARTLFEQESAGESRARQASAPR
ncbi:MAG: V-type ATP synthase subunit E [candidate division WOR-3 bacterium]